MMPGTSFDKFLTVHDVGRMEVRVNVLKTWEKYQSHLQRLLPDEIYARELWTSPHPLITQQILTGGPCFTLVPKGFISAGHWLPQNHSAYIRGKANKDAPGTQSIRVGFGSHPTRAELFLVPINAVQGKAGKTVPAFLGYIAPQEATLLADKLMLQSWLPVVLDLDETLLVATSAHQLLTQIHKATLSRNQAADEASSATTSTVRGQCQERQDALNHEIQSLEQDLNLLKQYRDGDCVVDPSPGGRGQILRAKYESAKLDTGVTQRPVIRLPGGIVLTRIDPSQKDTSMIMRIRPGWDALRAFLAPDPKGKRRFDVYVCTAAERGYALEAWRLLDNRNDIIPDEVRSARIVCVPGGQKKELRRVLHVQAATKFESGEAPPEAACAMPMAIIVDDRLDVWEPESQDQVLQVAPFAPHRPSPLGQGQMSNPQVRQAMIDEMAVVKDRMTAVRGHVYYDINHSLKPAVARLMQQGLRLEDHDAQVLPSVRTVAQLLKVHDLKLPQAPTGAPALNGAPSFVATEALLPHDPRQGLKGLTLQPPPALLQAPQQPVDPRMPRAAPGANPRQPFPRLGSIPSQPSASGPPGIQPWRPSPSFREQQQQPPALVNSHSSAHHSLGGSTASTQPLQQTVPQDPRRARLQQQPQPPPLLQPSGSGLQAGSQHTVNGFHALAGGLHGHQAAGAAAGGEAAGNSPAIAALHLDLALPLVKQQITWPNFNPISLIKEASDKQKVVCKFVERALPTRPGAYHPQFQQQIIWEGQEIGVAVEGDKKTAKKQAATKAIEFLLKYHLATSPAASPTQGPAGSSASGDGAGPSGGQGAPTRLENSLIREDNALATLQASFPKEVKYKTIKTTHPGSGRFCEMIDVMGMYHAARGTTTTKQAAKRWAAMRLLEELKHVISPAFYKDTPEGQQRGSRGPTQAEFHAATEVLFFNGQPVPRRRPPSSHQPPLQTQQQHSQQPQQHLQQQQQQLVFGEGSASTASWGEQVQQRQSWQGESGRGVKRAPGGEADMGAPVAKRSKHADQAASSQSQPGASLIDLTQPAAQAVYQDPPIHVEDISDEMADRPAQPDDASNMSEELLEQSGYPTDSSDEEEDQSGQMLNPTSEEAEDGRRERWRGMVYSNVENDVPEGNVNVQRGGDLTFLAAVKKQSKVKEGDWSEVKQQQDTNDNEDGMVDID